MFRSQLAVVFSIATLFLSLAVEAQNQNKDDQDKHLDIQSSAGDLHLGSDADASKTGLPLYPGARLSRDEDNKNAVNLGVLTEAFGLKLVVAKYESDDSPAKIIDFYRERLKKYGKVLECHSREHGDHADIEDDEEPRELKCEGDNSGPVTELKVGTKNNQHVVAIEPKNGHGGSSFALVYVHTHGKHGDI
jgi:hypothetical protein